MTYSSEVLADAPLVYWRLGEASGTSMVDASGNARNGTYSNFKGAYPTLSVAGLLTGDANTAADFTGNAYGYIADAAWMDVSTVGVEARIKVDTLTTDRTIVDRWDLWGGSLRSWSLYVSTAGKLVFKFWTVAGGQATPYTVTSATTLATGTAYTVAADYDGTTATLTINGSVDATLTQSGALAVGVASIAVGLSDQVTNGAALFDGIIDEVSIGGPLSSTRRATRHGQAVAAASVGLTIAGTLPAITASLTLSGYTDTTTRNRLTNGRLRGASFLDESPDPAAVLPTHLGQRFDKAIAYPTPDLVDGRPT